MRPTHQAHFHTRWQHLRNPHVRTLAWLLDAPGLLDAQAPEWSGRIATLGPADDAMVNWLADLDRNPEALIAALGIHPLTRLGRYAENLLAYYLRSHHRLLAQNIQVRGANNETAGEFDFLLHDGEELIHWEFATKLYLLEAGGAGHVADYFVGPNLADTLGAKIRKIMGHQLALSQHPNAPAVLPQAVARAQALVKGWLFYHGSTPTITAPPGILQAHCRGFWSALAELETRDMRHFASHFAILPRLSWLAPARLTMEEGMQRTALVDALRTHFAGGGAPVLIALLEPADDALIEFDRGFIVPDDWRERARRRITG